MTPLPIDSHLPQIVRQLAEAGSIVIVAAPGAGKTTRVPPAILRAEILTSEYPNVIILQLRRVAARAAAMRIAEENNWQLGREVGYHIRFEKKIGPETRLRILTEGVLTRQMLEDPFLHGIGAVILDEFHERSLNVDLSIAMLREVQQTVRQDLRIIVMSATLEAEPASRFLGNCPVVKVPGRTFGVEIEYHPHASASVAARVAGCVEEICARQASHGDVLAFLPGAEEIRRTMAQLAGLAERLDLALLPLHASLPTDQQMLALQPSPQRKIILATNIAETSLTIDGVRWVVDSGLAKIPMFDSRRGLDRLELKRISKASATQRAGRAGRTAPGRCLRLWSAKEHAALVEFESPEIKRVDLCGAVLDLHIWGTSDTAKFGWFEAPDASALQSAGRILEMLGVIRNSRITELGKRLSRLPLHPRIARLMEAAANAGCGDEGAAIAALLSEKDIRRSMDMGPRNSRTATTRGDSDILLRMDDLSEAERFHFAPHLRDRGIDPIAARQVVQIRNELQRLARRQHSASRKEPSRETLLKLLLVAYPDRVCRRRGDRSTAIMTGGSGVRLDPESIVTDHEFFLALDARDDPHSSNREAIVRIASAIEPQWLVELFPESISRDQTTKFDETRRRVVGKTIVRYRDLILSEEIGGAIEQASAGKALADALRPRAREIFSGDERAMNLLRRVALLQKIMPENPWPMFDDAALSDILEELSVGKSSEQEVMRESLADALMNRLPYPLDQLLRQHAPEALEVPSGSRIELQYRDDQPPVLAVRLQEIFGWRDTPRIAGGRVAVLLHLLGPNFRPVQITSDLKSFWATAYFQVRKDLRVRYPKHSWPDDPLTAPPVAKGRARKP